jgi:Zn-dependent peptidase ImmA (M78 family)
VINLNGILGLCDRPTKTIYIEANQSDKEKLHTLIHEIGHALFGRVGLCQGVNPEIEEVIVESIATTLIENNLLKD